MLMCMCMLTKRAQILFDENLWKQLVKAAEENNVSVAKYVRKTLEEALAEQKMLKQRRKAIEWTLKHRPKPFKGKIDYEELINYGRER